MTAKQSTFLLFTLLLSISSVGQPPTNLKQGKVSINKADLDKRIDSLFSSYTKKTPGIAVTVLENGNMLIRKSFGMASLEFDVPFSHNTIVRLPYAEGREFIAIAAVMMENEGLLSLKDKVRQYFPKLPNWSESVTIRHLLNNRSGFVDEWAVLLLTQGSMENRFDVSQFLELLYNQPAPGIEPGKGYMYCNSDYGLLRLILEKASGENLAAWMKRKIFEPQGMTSTRLHDNKNEVIAGFAHEYHNEGRGRYNRWIGDKTSPGGNYYIATSAADIEKWAKLHADPDSYAAKAIQYLKKDAILMPGKGKNYVFGSREQSEDGYTLITHHGVNDRPYLSRFPLKGYAVIILGNTDANYVQFHQTIMNWLLGVKKQVIKLKQFTPTPTKYTKAQLQQLTGRYFDADTVGFESFTKDRKNGFNLIVHNDSLKWEINENTLIALVPVAPYVFKDPDYEAYMEFILPKTKNEPVKINTYLYPSNKIHYHIRDNSVLWTPSKNELLGFVGKYYSPHLDFYWTLLLDDEGRLIVKRPTIFDTELIAETKDVFTLMVDKYPNSPFEVFVHFHRDALGQITHFTVSDPRLMHHRFDKQ